MVEDFAALGVLNEAAVARGHVSAHDEAARRAGPGTGAIYRLLEGAAAPADARVAVWVDKPRGVPAPMLAGLLGDGMDARARRPLAAPAGARPRARVLRARRRAAGRRRDHAARARAGARASPRASRWRSAPGRADH